MSGGRGLLTEREKEVLSGDGSKPYQLNIKNKVEERIEKLQHDCDYLRKNEPELFAILQIAICDLDCDTPVFQGKYESNEEFVLYKNGTEWNQSYYKDNNVTWGKQGGSTGQALTAEILIRESMVSSMTVGVSTLRDFINDFSLNTDHNWETSAFEIRKWYYQRHFSSGTHSNN